MTDTAPEPTFAQDILYILASESNQTGLSAQRARMLTATILQQMRATLGHLCRSGARSGDPLYTPMVFTDVDDLVAALDLNRDMLAEPRHEWEPERAGVDLVNDLFARLHELTDELTRTNALLAECRRELAKARGLSLD